MIELTYVMVKPDVMKRPKEERNVIIEDIVNTLNDNGLDVISMKKDRMTKDIAEEHYAHLKDKSFYGELTDFMTSDDVLEMIVLGDDAVSKVRTLIGPTNVAKAKEEAPTSIRAKYGDPDFGSANAIHASDSKENALIEIKRFFNIELEQPKYTISKNSKQVLSKHNF